MKVKQRIWWVLAGIFLLFCVSFVVAAYRFGWSSTGFVKKSLWDWLQLLIVPLMLAIIALVFQLANSRTERQIAKLRYEQDQSIALDKQREDLLQIYLDRMSELLLKEQLGSPESKDEIRKVARVRTITVLFQLDARRIGYVFAFLREAGLMSNKPNSSIVHLHQANLQKINLSEADLSESDFSEADLWGANLRKANLREANLKGATLWGATLDEAHLWGADLSGTELSGAHLTRAFLMKVNLSNATLWEADLRKAILSEACLRGAKLHEADLSEAGFNEADLSEASLWQSNLRGAYFKGANLSNANLNETILSNANLSKANLRGTHLWQADLRRADLSKADLRGATLGGADLSKANLSEADLSGANLSGVDLSGANLSRTNIEVAQSLKDTDLRGVKGLTKEQLEACKAKGAIIGDAVTTSPPQSTVSPSLPLQGNDTQIPADPPSQVNTLTLDTDGSSATSSQPSPGA